MEFRRVLLRSAVVSVLLSMAQLPGAANAADYAPNIAAASSLKFALEEVAARFEADTGRKVALSFGSSGNFHRQIIQGAPFQMFLSADEGFVEQLAGAGKTVDRSEEHTSELQSLMRISYAVFCLKKKKHDHP